IRRQTRHRFAFRETRPRDWKAAENTEKSGLVTDFRGPWLPVVGAVEFAFLRRERTRLHCRGGEGPRANGPVCLESLPYPTRPHRRPIDGGVARSSAAEGAETTSAPLPWYWPCSYYD